MHKQIKKTQGKLPTTNASLDDGYRAMAADIAREVQAVEWCNALAEDSPGSSRVTPTRHAQKYKGA